MASMKLLPYQLEIRHLLFPTLSSNDSLLVLAPGLGLRKIVVSFLQTQVEFDSTIPSSKGGKTVLLNATVQDIDGLREEVGLNFVDLDGLNGMEERYHAYRDDSCRLVAVTSRVFITDLLSCKVSLNKISGLVILNAEQISITSTESFIIKVYRDSNKTGFLKAFSDSPESFTRGFSPLQSVLKALKLRKVLLWPRFHELVQHCLSTDRKVNVVEMHIPLSPSMDEIQTAIIDCMEATLAEVKRATSSIDVETLDTENALFRSFDALLRNHLDPIWSRLSGRTRQLISDLTTLRNLLHYLLTYDCVSFNKLIETILQSNTVNMMTGHLRQNQSPWLFLPSAETIISASKGRVFKKRNQQANIVPRAGTMLPDEDEEAAFLSLGGDSGRFGHSLNWFGDKIESVLEEQPKWDELYSLLEEIETELFQRSGTVSDAVSQSTILIMCSSATTCSILREYVSERRKSTAPHDMLCRRLREYLFWRNEIFGKKTADAQKTVFGNSETCKPTGEQYLSMGLKRKTEGSRNRQPLTKRRRTRGGSASSSAARDVQDLPLGKDDIVIDSTVLAQPAASRPLVDAETLFDAQSLGDNFCLLEPNDEVVVQCYSGDDDDFLLEELRPQYVIMFEPDPAFIRRVEVFQASYPHFTIRVYFMIYSNSTEEQIYLSTIRREKDAFEQLIRENATMAIPLEAEHPSVESTTADLARVISSRKAGGGILSVTRSQIVVDHREFRSPLPFLLYNSGVKVVPMTLLVGDYVLSPTICVERKSIPDLIQSLNSGRLYQQCEVMVAHYQTPILLIEFSENKSFGLDTYLGLTQVTGGYDGGASDLESLHAKIILLTLSFQRLRVMWSSSSHETAQMFQDLKQKEEEPDAEVAVTIGGEDFVGEFTAQYENWNQSGQDALLSLPGIHHKNFRYLMEKASNFHELCEMSNRELENCVGAEQGKLLWKFLHETEM